MHWDLTNNFKNRLRTLYA